MVHFVVYWGGLVCTSRTYYHVLRKAKKITFWPFVWVHFIYAICAKRKSDITIEATVQWPCFKWPECHEALCWQAGGGGGACNSYLDSTSTVTDSIVTWNAWEKSRRWDGEYLYLRWFIFLGEGRVEAGLGFCRRNTRTSVFHTKNLHSVSSQITTYST